MVILGYCSWRNKPVGPIFFTGICINLITQSLLWVVLNVFFRHYLIILFMAEGFIWFVEALCLYLFKPNRLGFGEAILLSFLMNIASFAAGWLLPV
jgi:hypothetical protein